MAFHRDGIPQDLIETRLKNLIDRATKALRARFACEVAVTDDFVLKTKPHPRLQSREIQILAAVTGLLAPPIAQLFRRHQEAQRYETALGRLLQSIGSRNVYSLERFRRDRVPSPKLAPKNQIYFAAVCFLEGATAADRQAMALELHQASHRVALIPFADLDPEVRKSGRQLQSLGNITLFIAEIAQLSSAEHAALMECCEGPRTSFTPHVIAGSNKSYNQLAGAGVVPTPLLDALTARTFHPTRLYDPAALPSGPFALG
jgi:hypothetical protein